VKQFEITHGVFRTVYKSAEKQKSLLDLPEPQTNKRLNVIIMSSSATDQTRERTVEHAADTIKKKPAENKRMNNVPYVEREINISLFNCNCS
jgi:hypothetical protein